MGLQLSKRQVADGGKSLTAARRIEVPPFAAYCQQFDPATEIPPRGLFGRAHHRLRPHIFTQDEILDLLADCDQLYPLAGLRGATCATICGLIASTGLRISEATGLTRPDVDIEQRLLHIRCAKFGNYAAFLTMFDLDGAIAVSEGMNERYSA